MRRPAPVLAVVLGLGLFALGLVAATRWLPEWQVDGLPEEEVFTARFRAVAAELGVELDPRGALDVRVRETYDLGEDNPYAALGTAAGRWLVDEARPLLVRVEGRGELAGAGAVNLELEMGLDGRVWEATLERPPSLTTAIRAQGAEPLPVPEAAVVHPGETVADVALPSDGSRRAVRELAGGDQVVVVHRQGLESSIDRYPFSRDELEGRTTAGWWSRTGMRIVLWLVLFLVTGSLSFVLALRSRISLRNGAWLLAVLLALDLALLLPQVPPAFWIFLPVPLGISLGVVFLGWAAGESWLRDIEWSKPRWEGASRGAPGRSGGSLAALDALLAGRIGPRVGAALPWGLGWGATMAGARLALIALGAQTGWALPTRATIDLPLAQAPLGLIDFAAARATLVLLAWAAASVVLPRRARFAGATLVAALVVAPLRPELFAFPADFGLALVLVGCLSLALRLGGSLGLLTASLSAELLQAATYALQAPGWMGWELGVAAGSLAVLGLVAAVGSRRPEDVDEEVAPPEFLRRLNEERRLTFEMDLLARMQTGLLPAGPPRLVGWQIAARSMVAHEVGGDFYDFFETGDGAVWIAAGDVAGHGSFCSIGHAMTKAALASLIRPGRTPGAVLVQVDRVLRGLHTRRLFTALALVRLDPSTGEALLANAGYPYPLQVAPAAPVGGGLDPAERVVEHELPGLPVGEGPARSYPDLPIVLPPGGALVFCSDGLHESFGSHGGPERPYGFSRPRRVLEASRASSAEELLGELVEDWRRFVGAGSPADDTTLLVVRREL